MHKFRNDLILIMSILVLCGIAIVLLNTCSKTENLRAKVYYDSKEILNISLDKDDTYTIQGEISEITIQVKNKKISIIESGCEDKVCIHQGEISSTNKTITCLPNKVYIKLVGSKGADASI